MDSEVVEPAGSKANNKALTQSILGIPTNLETAVLYLEPITKQWRPSTLKLNDGSVSLEADEAIIFTAHLDAILEAAYVQPMLVLKVGSTRYQIAFEDLREFVKHVRSFGSSRYRNLNRQAMQNAQPWILLFKAQGIMKISKATIWLIVVLVVVAAAICLAIVIIGWPQK